jgi:tetratricopeptide (TPR) repeat protein
MRLLLEKTPLFIMSATSAAIAFFVQKNAGGIVTADNYTFSNRVANAILSYATYIGKMLWPEHLAVFYPYVESIPGWRLAGSMALLILLSALAILWIRRYPFFIVGWLWYIGSLIPVIGLVKIGDFAMADRYTYIPLIGLFIIIAWGLPEVFRNSRYKKAVLGPLAAAVLVILAIVASSQVRHWTNSQTLFEHALKVTKKNFFAHYALGNSLMSQGKSDKAIKHFSEAARIKPDKAPLHIDLGRALASRGNFKEAFPHFRKALEIDPNKANIHYYLGVVLVKQKKMNDAIEHFLEALRLSPEFKNNETCVDERRFNDLSNKRKDSHEVLDTSIGHYDQILSYQPGCLEALIKLASAYSQKEKYSEALSLLKIEKSNEGLRRAAIEGIRHWELLESSK